MPRIYHPKGNSNTYTDMDRYFAAQSEMYTGADSLLTAQRQGWCLVNIVYEEAIPLRSGRFTTIYYFKLLRDSETLVMPVVANPFIEQMLIRLQMFVRPFPSRNTSEPGEKVLEVEAIDVQELA